MSRFRPIAATFAVIAVACSSDKRTNDVQPTVTVDAGKQDAGSTLTNTSTATETNQSPLDAGIPTSNELLCNGRAPYCALHYDEFCQAATHDSAANSAAYWTYPAQSQSVRAQLDSSISALMLSLHNDGNAVTVCRGNCNEGSTPLSVVLDAVAGFLVDNPRSIVTLLIDASLSAQPLESAFTAKGLDGFALAQPAGAPWPTLQDMIDTGERLVVLATTPDVGAAWLLPRQSLVWETADNWTSLAAMNCNPAVGKGTEPLYLVHHNLVDQLDAGNSGVPSAMLAAEANAFGVVTQRLQNCEQQLGRVPNFVAVDFSNIGDTVGGTQVINGVRAAPLP